MLRVLTIAGIFAVGTAALAQGCGCSEWDGFRRTCVPCSEPGSGSGISDEEREANRRAREQRWRDEQAQRAARDQQREEERADRILRQINALIEQANAELDAAQRARALDHLWDAYRLNPGDPVLRANVIRVVFDEQLTRGQLALRRGDASAIRAMQRAYRDIQPLWEAGVAGVHDEADLILQRDALDTIVGDLDEAARDRRRRETLDQLEDPADALAGQRLRANALDPLQLTWLWATGGGPRDYAFGPDHRVTRDLRNSAHGRLVRYLLYQKYGGRLRNGDSFTNYVGTFGLVGLFTTRTLSEQFVGSFRIDAEVVDGNIRYTATNTTSFTSFLYGGGPSWDDKTLRPMSNMRQTYVWWEPVQRWPGR